MNLHPFLEHLDELHDCAICPRNCHVDRFNGVKGYCKSDTSFNIASICIHQGEEPVISGLNGICNIFFTNCNLRCIYCQNYQISDQRISRSLTSMTFEEVLRQITVILDQGIGKVGFVSPSHFIPHVLAIIDAVHSLGYSPRWVYNSNGYDKTESLKRLEGKIDIYLPDLKYMDRCLSGNLSDAADYPEVAGKALKEMFRQKGSTLILDEQNTAESGLIVRHLVLPRQLENSLSVIRFLSTELSPRVHLSLMSQYYPIRKVVNHEFLGEMINKKDYEQILDEMFNYGMENGWFQDIESARNYQPDFDKIHPFDNL